MELDINQCARFKAVREKLGMKQNDFAKALAISQGHASDIENGRKGISDRIVEILSLKFNVNEMWLRTGIGDMITPLSRNDEIAMFAADIIKEPDTSFRKRLVEVLAQLNEQQWETLAQIAEMLAKEKE